VDVNSAIHHVASAQQHADAIRASLREPRLPDIELPRRSRRRRVAFVWRLRAALV
jgi:hypothetical protein